MALSDHERRILQLIAGGHSYDEILAATPGLSYLDIFAAVQSALEEMDSPAYTVSDVRELHPNAYRPWTPEDEEELERRARAGESMEEIAGILGRSVGALESRLVRILLGR